MRGRSHAAWRQIRHWMARCARRLHLGRRMHGWRLRRHSRFLNFHTARSIATYRHLSPPIAKSRTGIRVYIPSSLGILLYLHQSVAYATGRGNAPARGGVCGCARPPPRRASASWPASSRPPRSALAYAGRACNCARGSSRRHRTTRAASSMIAEDCVAARPSRRHPAWPAILRIPPKMWSVSNSSSPVDPRFVP